MQLIYITHRKFGTTQGPIYAAADTLKQVCAKGTVFINAETREIYTLQDIGANRTITCTTGQAIVVGRPQKVRKAVENGQTVLIEMPLKLSLRPVKTGEATPYDKKQFDKWAAQVRNLPFPPVFECEDRFPGADAVYLLPNTLRHEALNAENPIFLNNGNVYRLEDKDFVVTQDRARLRIVGDEDIGQVIKALEPDFDETALNTRLGRNSRD